MKNTSIQYICMYIVDGVLTRALKALAKGSVMQQSQKMLPLKWSGADDQHVRGDRVGQFLHPAEVPHQPQVASPHC